MLTLIDISLLSLLITTSDRPGPRGRRLWRVAGRQRGGGRPDLLAGRVYHHGHRGPGGGAHAERAEICLELWSHCLCGQHAGQIHWGAVSRAGTVGITV